MLTFLQLQRSALSPDNSRASNRLPEIPTLPAHAHSARVECTVSHHTFGRVFFQGGSWRAKSIHNRVYHPGTQVRVVCRQENALWVDTLPENTAVSTLEARI